MKRIIALILILCISSLFVVLPTSAEGEVYVSAGNIVLPLSGALPIRSSGVWYIDYQCFTKGSLGVNTSYNATDGLLVLYTWDTTLIFDLKATVAYTAADRIQYKAVSFVSNGTVYVPVQFTAQMLGFDYTYFSDLPMIRIKKSGDIQDNMFMYIAENEIAELKNASASQPVTPADRPGGNSSVTPHPESDSVSSSKPSGDPVSNPGSSGSTSGDTMEQSPSEQTSPQVNDEKKKNEEDVPDTKNIKLTFNITDGTKLTKILEALSAYGYHATFFIRGNTINSCENEIRRAIVSGHTIGILSYNGDEDFSLPDEELEDLLSKTNRSLFEISKTKTRLLRVPGRSSSLSDGRADMLISLGYRLWDSDFTPSGNYASTVYNSTISKLKSPAKDMVIEFSDSDIHIKALPRILRYLKTNNHNISRIELLDIPVNNIGDKR